MSSPHLSYDAFGRIAPAARDALIALGKAADESGFDLQIVELAKLRVSQINNCAFCLQIHLNESRKLGVPQEKLDLVTTCEEAPRSTPGTGWAPFRFAPPIHRKVAAAA